jgi:hypothetical protein
MKRIIPLFLFLWCAPLSFAHSITVGQIGEECPDAQYIRIQDAVTAASPGTTIIVCPGIYDEQPQINKPLKMILDKNALIRPTTVLPNGFSLSSGVQFVSLLLVANTTNVEIDGGQFDGIEAGITGCAPRLFGIVFQNASGTIRHTTLRNTKLNEGLNGCQSGTGILIQSGNGGKSRVIVEGNRLSDYQKNGITIDGVGSDAKIVHNRVTGVGSTKGAAQNGIQVGFGATGEVAKNTVSQNEWAGCTSVDACEFFATGVLVEQSNNVKVLENLVSGNQVNLVFDGDSNVAERNSLLNAEILDDVQVQGNDCTVEKNLIARADRAGVYVSGNNAEVEDNTFVDMLIGIFEAQGAQDLRHSDNVFIHVTDEFKDPPSQTSRPVPDKP